MKKKRIILLGSLIIGIITLVLLAKIGSLTNFGKLKGSISNLTSTEAKFLTGEQVNIKMKVVAGDATATKDTSNSNITAIKRASSVPSYYENANNKVSVESGSPIYLWFDSGTIYWYTTASTVYLNEDSSYLFANLKNLTTIPDISQMITSGVTNMSYMFYGTRGLITLNLANFITNNVTDMSHMFENSTVRNLFLDNFITKKVTTMDSMFKNCSNLVTLDLSSFELTQLSTAESMFNGCSNLETIYTPLAFDLDGKGSTIFTNATSLSGGSGTTYQSYQVTGQYGHVDGYKTSNLNSGSTSPDDYIGYFTYKLCKSPKSSALHTDGDITYGHVPAVNTFSIGDAYICDINGDGDFNPTNEMFYYISDYYDTETNKTDNTFAALYYYNNVGDSIYADSINTISWDLLHNNYGFLSILPSNLSQTSGRPFWKASVLKDYTRVTNGHSIDYSGKGARLATYDEMKGCFTDNNIPTNISSSCNFILENIGSGSTSGMWLETNTSNTYIVSIDKSSSNQTNRDVIDQPFNRALGIRPVIDVKKTAFDKTANYTVTFAKADGTTIDTQTVISGRTALKPSNPTSNDKVFVGWYTDTSFETEYDFDTILTDNLTIYAKFVNSSVTITFNPGEGTLSNTTKAVVPGAQIGELPVPTPQTGKVFDGWYTSTEYTTKVTETTTFDADTTLYAKYSDITITITFDPQGGIFTNPSSETLTLTYGQLLTLPEVTKENSVFQGWFTTTEYTEQVYSGTTVFSDATYYAKWGSSEGVLCKRATTSELHKSGNITYGQIGTNGELNIGDAFICDVNGDGTYSAANEMFYYVSDFFDFNTLQSDSSYAALVYSKNYAEQIRYVSDLTTSPTVEFVTALPTTSEWSNVTLKNNYRIVYDYTLNSRLYAVYQGSVSHVGKAARLLTYEELKGCVSGSGFPISLSNTCNFLMEDADSSYPVLLETIDVNANETKSGIVINSDGRLSVRQLNYIGTIKPTIDVPKNRMDLSAETPVVSYTITFNAGDGTVSETSRTVNENTAIGDLPTATPPENKAFEGWYKESTYETKVTSSTVFDSDATLYARYIDNTVTITFDAQGGTFTDPSMATVTVGYGQNVSLPEVTKSNEVFGGWYTSTEYTEQVFDNLPVFGDATYYAKWVPVASTVTFDPNGGELAEESRTKLVDTGTAVGTLPTPTKSNETFVGWYTSTEYKEQVTTETIVEGDVTYYAKWSSSGTSGITIVDTDDVTLDGTTIIVKNPIGNKLDKTTLLDRVTVSGDYTLLDVDGNEITAVNQGVGTGSTLTVGGTTYTILLRGDLNGDGKLGLTDIIMIYGYMKDLNEGKTSSLNNYQKLAADYSCDGSVTISDIIGIYRKMKGEIVSEN